jgi:outer membrane protein assembly factor BamB
MNPGKISMVIALSMACFLPAFNQADISRQWPQFHGYMGKGILDHADLPDKWDLQTGENVLWKTPIPGLAHSCPVIWDDLVFVTTAISSASLDSLKIGLYGDIDMASDTSAHQFKVYCLDRKSGKIIWDRIAYEGVPKERRHTKSTYANPTPATDGKHLVVSFGSNGLYCYDLAGKLIWKKDLGNLATGPYNEDSVEWGYSSSPIIHDGKIVIQCDLLKNSFLVTLDVATGNEKWRIDRDAISSWGSPCIYEGGNKTLIILNGYPFVRAYDFKTGEEIWKAGNVGDAPAPTAVIANNLVYINNAHGKFSPIMAIRPDASGDITLPADTTKSGNIVWSFKRGGAYMASPLVYGDYLYNMQINGQLTCIEALTGAVKYKKDLGKAFSASGVASDGKLYFPAETGEILVLQPGSEYKLLAENNMGDVCMATPAIGEGMIIFRTQHSMIAVGKKKI